MGLLVLDWIDISVFAEFWYKMLLREVGVYLSYLVIDFSRWFLKLNNRIVDIPYLSAGSVWRLRYLLCLIGRQS